MKFTTSCFVRVEDVDKRKKLVEWLEGQIGYRYCVGYYNARSVIDSPLIPYVLVSTRAETGFVQCFVQRPDEGIDCDTDVELFKALAAMNDENDLEQWYVYKKEKNEDVRFLKCTIPNITEWYYMRWYYMCRKATTEEIIEYFNRKLHEK